jgi:pimeloyl-ACP methyl ester carboxylesterase
MPELTHQGRRLHYLDEGSGPPVLLLHGFPLNASMFRPQLGALADRYRFIVPDLRGFGRSEPGQGPTQMTTFAQDAVAILDHLGIEAAVVGGVSMGGYIALALLELHPGRVRALVLSDTQTSPDDEAGKVRREELAVAIETEGPAVLERNFLPKLLAQPPRPEVEQTVRQMIGANSVAGMAAAARGMALRPDRRHILARFAGPALMIVGERDAITPPAKLEQMAALVPGSKLQVLEGVGHLPNLEAPEGFNHALDAFLRSLG